MPYEVAQATAPPLVSSYRNCRAQTHAVGRVCFDVPAPVSTFVILRLSLFINCIADFVVSRYALGCSSRVYFIAMLNP